MLPRHRLELYRDRSGLWRYRIKARNHKIVDDSEQGFRHRWYARRKAREAWPDAVEVPAS